MATSTWSNREQPILEAVAEVEADTSGPVHDLDLLEDLTGLDRPVLVAGVRALLEATPPYLSALYVGGFSGDDWLDFGLMERGRRATGQWPPENAAEALLALLEARLDQVDDAEERTRLQRALEGLKGLGGRALEQVTIAYLKQMAGLG